jgi:5,6-dimethylbenzimidazole synthase
MNADIYDVIHRRRDVRAEFTGEPISEDVLVRVLSAAHAAPSVGLSQPWDFIVVSDPAVRRAFYDHVQHERAVFAATLTTADAERFARIKIDGVLESTLSIVVTYDPERGSPAVLGRHAIADAGLYSVTGPRPPRISNGTAGAAAAPWTRRSITTAGERPPGRFGGQQHGVWEIAREP